jgi:hypothetical protein
MSFAHSIDQINVGANAQADVTFTLPVEPEQLAGAQVAWDILDFEGAVWNSGEAASLGVTPSAMQPGMYKITADATISVPSRLPVNASGTRYQLRWTLKLKDGREFPAFDNFTVLPISEVHQGPVSVVEIFGNTAYLNIVLPKKYPMVAYEIYKGNAKVKDATIAANINDPTPVAGGFVYNAQINTQTFADVGVGPSLEPYLVIWRYGESNAIFQQETGELYMVTPSVVGAQQEIVRFLAKSYTDAGIDPGTEFSPEAIMSYLRMGRDQFNAAVMPTEFTMLNAISAFRYFWLQYSIAYACRSQYLAEGLRAFNFSGQVVTLDIDRTQFWDSLATQLETSMSEHIRNFKTNLYKRGIVRGDGSNVLGLQPGAIGSIGISISPVSPVRGTLGMPGYGPFLR